MLAAAFAAATRGQLGAGTGNGVAHEGGAHYAQLFGQTYRTKVDLYLFALYDDTDSLYLGRNDGTAAARLPALPSKVDPRNIGRSFGKITIVDVVPAGAEFVLIAETHEVTRESGICELGGYSLGLICTLLTHPENGVLCEFIQHGHKAPPNTPNQKIDEALAENLSH
jgi:hypothetical protein